MITKQLIREAEWDMKPEKCGSPGCSVSRLKAQAVSDNLGTKTTKDEECTGKKPTAG